MTVLDNIQLRGSPEDRALLVESRVGTILHQIHQALCLFHSQCKATTIDLKAQPFGPGEEELLLHHLGQGEVKITIDTMGCSTINETAFAGVWLVDHRNEQNERIAFQLEVDRIPTFACAPLVEIERSVMNLATQLEIDNKQY